MSALDVETLLQDVSSDAPCGDDLEYDPAFGEMEQAAQGKPEQQYGDTIIAAEEPDWREVKRQALTLLSRTKDLRVAVSLARACLAMDGHAGFRDALALLRGFVEGYWETVHPQLDPDDDHDPTLRVNTLMALCDADTTLRQVREAPLVSSRAVGRFSLRDVLIAEGELPPPAGDEKPPEKSTIEAAFLDADADELQATGTALQEATEHVQAIEAAVTEQVGVSDAPEMSALVHLLRGARKVVSEQLTRRGIGVAADEGTSDEDGAPHRFEGNGAAAQPVQRLTGEIHSREDVVRALDKICEYYDRYEPSSPLPLLLKRAKRLASKSFLEIIRDLAPDALSQAEALGGLSEEEPAEY